MKLTEVGGQWSPRVKLRNMGLEETPGLVLGSGNTEIFRTCVLISPLEEHRVLFSWGHCVQPSHVLVVIILEQSSLTVALLAFGAE